MTFFAERWRLTPEPYAPPMGTPDISQWPAILDGVMDYRPWYPDAIWEQGPQARREHASAYIIEAWSVSGAVWSVLRDTQIVGIFLLNRVRAGQDASAHFIFFDHELRSKRQLCRQAMAVAFDEFNLEALRVEIPEYASELCGFVRKALGFRYEAERRLSDPKLARRASIKHHAVRYKGKWNDAYLLSVTREEFSDFVRAKHDQSRRLDSPPAGADGRDTELPPGSPP